MHKFSLTIAALAVAAIMVLLPTGTAQADGGLFGREGNDIYEPGQKAVIFFHDGTEEMVLSVRYDGAAEEFAWLVPTPAQPEVEESDILLFQLMSAFTPPDAGTQGDGTMGRNGSQEWAAGVEVLDTKMVGPFDLTVVRSGSAADLEAWLNDRGFAYDSRAEGVLADYVSRGWCFTAMRVNPSYLEGQGQEWAGTEYQLAGGTISPLRFTFTTEQPVYPLYISSLNPGGTEVLLYMLGEEPYIPYIDQAMSLEYAEAWQPGQIAALSDFSALASRMEEEGGCYLIKLRCSFQPSEMRDLYFASAGAEARDEWPGLTRLAGAGTASGSGDGVSFPWWELLAAALILAAVIAGLNKRVAAFPVWALAIFVALLPLGLLMYNAEKNGSATVGGWNDVAAAQSPWPWSSDILLNRDGWSVLVHPDGRSEVVGLEEGLAMQVARLKVEPEPGEYGQAAHHVTGDLEYRGKELAGTDGWRWSVGLHRDDYSQSSYLRITDDKGVTHEAELASLNVHDVRLSPVGDRLWVALNPGVPVNKTEVLEYAFPSLELTNTVIHDQCMRDGEIVLSAEGEPLLAGHFATGDGLDEFYGFLPLLEAEAGYEGERLEIDYDLRLAETEPGVPVVGYGAFIDAEDGSPFLLIGGAYDFESQAYVLDTRDGQAYEVTGGWPEGWR